MTAPVPPGAPARPTATPELRRLLLFMVLAVVALHVGAIALHTTLGVAERPPGFQRLFAGAWMVASVLVVLPFMLRIRAARLRARHARRRGAGA